MDIALTVDAVGMLVQVSDLESGLLRRMGQDGRTVLMKYVGDAVLRAVMEYEDSDSEGSDDGTVDGKGQGMGSGESDISLN